MTEIKIIEIFNKFTDNWDEDEETMELEYTEELADVLSNIE
jgi:hypothetical protein